LPDLLELQQPFRRLRAVTVRARLAILLASRRASPVKPIAHAVRACLVAILLSPLALGGAGAQQPPAAVTIEKLLVEGWEVTGYIAAWENRSLILFRHKERHHLVQCSVLVDVMRNPRVVTTCYELR
jgi:hypothetical protein